MASRSAWRREWSSSLAHKTVRCAVSMYLPGPRRWSVSFGLSRGFQMYLEQGLWGMSSADYPMSPPSPWPFLTLLWPHRPALSFFGSSSGPPLSLHIHCSLCLECPPFHFICSPEKLPVVLRPKHPPLALASVPSTGSLPSQRYFTSDSLVH